MRHRWVVLLLITLLLTTAAPSGAAENEPVPWSPEMAKALVALGWEHPSTLTERPVVVYSLQLVELDTQRSQVYELQGGVTKGSEAGEWHISADQSELQVVARSLDVLLSPMYQALDEGRVHEVWLVTVAPEPVQLQIGEASVSGRASRIDLTLTPQKVDAQGQRMLTEFTMEARSPNGTESTASTTVWTRANEPTLVAVVTQQDDGVRHERRRHIALYLRGTVVAADNVPSRLPLLPIGNVKALEMLLTQEPPQRALPVSRVLFGLHEAGGSMGVETDIRVRTEAGNALRFSLIDGSGYGTSAFQMNIRLIEELAALVRLDMTRPGQAGAAVRLGVGERKQLGSWEAAASVLPIAYEIGHGWALDPARVELALRYVGETWELFAEAKYGDGLESTIGFGLNSPNGRQGLQFTWTYSERGPTRVGVRAIAMEW